LSLIQFFRFIVTARGGETFIGAVVYFYDCWWCVVLLKRHSSIVRLPGRTCKHVRAPISHPTISEGELGSSVITHASTWGDTY